MLLDVTFQTYMVRALIFLFCLESLRRHHCSSKCICYIWVTTRYSHDGGDLGTRLIQLLEYEYMPWSLVLISKTQNAKQQKNNKTSNKTSAKWRQLLLRVYEPYAKRRKNNGIDRKKYTTLIIHIYPRELYGGLAWIQLHGGQFYQSTWFIAKLMLKLLEVIRLHAHLGCHNQPKSAILFRK